MISEFKGQYAFLSNFHQAEFTLGGRGFPDIEHYFQSAKAVRRQDFEWVRSAGSPAEAKRRGRQTQCREDWDQVKRPIMLNACLAKFTQHPDLRHQLALTGDETLAEGNSWGDTYWGAVAEGARGWSQEILAVTDPAIEPLAGHNYLGQILMAVRMVLC
jgi:ribA/ribD-fused uncharacterized protein